MVKVLEDKFDNVTTTDVAIAGASSGLITRALIQPLDVVKIRFQLQVEPIKKNTASKYTSLHQAATLILREEGLAAFWKGHVPAQLLSISFGFIQFWCFEMLVQRAKIANIYEDHRTLTNFASGATAGTLGTIMTFPYDLLRTRLVAQKNKVYKGLTNGFIHVLQNEGPVGLFRGISPTLIAVAPNAGCLFMFYHFFDEVYRKFVSIEPDSYNVAGNMFAGSLAGCVSKILLYPLDLMRKRMQIQGFQEHRHEDFGRKFKCQNLIDCFMKVHRYEGIAGMFKGLSPSIAKALLASALTFTSFEFVCQLIHNIKD